MWLNTIMSKCVQTELDWELYNHMNKSIVGTLETDEIIFQEDPNSWKSYNQKLAQLQQ